MIERRVRQTLRTNFDTTLPRFDVLASNRPGRPSGQPMRELSHRLMVTNGNITASRGSVEEDGLVIREPSAKDRRVQHVKLTDAGSAALDAIDPRKTIAGSPDLMRRVDRDRASDLYALLGDLQRVHLSIREISNLFRPRPFPNLLIGTLLCLLLYLFFYPGPHDKGLVALW